MLIPSISADELKQLSPASLAYVGDAVYELYMRCHFLTPPTKISNHHDKVVAEVKAETQALYLQRLEAHLTQQENDVVRRGRNAATGKPKRVSLSVYGQATGLEALIGYLYLTDRERLDELLRYLPSTGP